MQAHRLATLVALYTTTAWVTAQQDDPFPAAPPESVGVDPTTLGALASQVATFVEAGQVVGAELLVIRRRRTVLHQAFGQQDRESDTAMVLDTIFNIRSMTKPLVGAAAQMLIDEGRLSLADPVAKHLPAFDRDGAGAITIEHLLTHRSGLPDGNPPGDPSTYPGLRAVAEHWAGVGPTEGEPGSRFVYSDPGADVLGAVVAEVAGEPLEDFVTRRVLTPLGMRDSFAMTAAGDPRAQRVASAYRMTGSGWQRYWKPGDGPLLPFVVGSGTTWYASPRDYARFVCLWLDDGLVGEDRLLSQAAVERALRPVSRMDYLNRLTGLSVRYGQMWQVYVDRAGETVAFGHSGSDGTYAWVWPDEDLIVLYFTQSRGQVTRLFLEARLGDLIPRNRERPAKGAGRR